MIRINREAKQTQYQPPDDTPFCQKVANVSRNFARANCSKRTMKHRASVTFLSFPKQLVDYKWATFASDLIAGLTVAFVRLPQGMAYALLAGLPPQYGLYTELFGCLFYSLFATARQNSVGTNPILCLMIGLALQTRNIESNDVLLSTNSTVTTTEMENVAFVQTMTLLVGIIQAAMALMQFGFVSILLPRHLISGFTCGVAYHVMTSQVRVLLGLSRTHVPRRSGPGSFFLTWVDMLSNLPNADVESVIISVISIAIIWTTKILSRRYSKQLRKLPIPGELFVVIVFTIFTTFFEYAHKIEQVGEIPAALPTPRVPSLKAAGEAIGSVIPIAIISYILNLSLAKKFAAEFGYTVDANQEAVASSISNIFGSFFFSMPTAVSLSRSSLQASAGGRTQLTSLMSVVMLGIVVGTLGVYFSVLPKAVLASIVVVNLRGMLRQALQLPAILRFSMIDGAVWIVAFLATIVLGTEIGLGVAVLFLLLTLAYRAYGEKPSDIRPGLYTSWLILY